MSKTSSIERLYDEIEAKFEKYRRVKSIELLDVLKGIENITSHFINYLELFEWHCKECQTTLTHIVNISDSVKFNCTSCETANTFEYQIFKPYFSNSIDERTFIDLQIQYVSLLEHFFLLNLTHSIESKSKYLNLNIDPEEFKILEDYQVQLGFDKKEYTNVRLKKLKELKGFNFVLDENDKIEISFSIRSLKRKQSRNFSSEIRKKVWIRDAGCCVSCGSKESLEFDHVIPFSKGGDNSIGNCQILCRKCNRNKSNKIM